MDSIHFFLCTLYWVSVERLGEKCVGVERARRSSDDECLDSVSLLLLAKHRLAYGGEKNGKKYLGLSFGVWKCNWWKIKEKYKTARKREKKWKTSQKFLSFIMPTSVVIAIEFIWKSLFLLNSYFNLFHNRAENIEITERLKRIKNSLGRKIFRFRVHTLR